MTNEEAIEILRSIRVYDVYPKSASEETKQAIDFAIEALKEIDKHGNCILTMFGDCSYQETGCSDCKIIEKIGEALKKKEAENE